MNEGDDIAERQPPGCGVGFLALASAAVLVALPITILMGDIRFYPFVTIVTTVVALTIGAVAFAIIRDAPNALKVAIGGFATGAGFPLLLVLVSIPDSASVGGVATVVGGRYTVAGWIQNLAFIGGFGVAGITGALIAWGLIHWLGKRRREAVVAVAAVILTGSIAAGLIPELTYDRSCHNPLRDGGTSISPVAEAKFTVPMSDWQNLQSELDRFARENGWQVRADVRPDPGFPWFQASLCRESGTNIFVSQDPFIEGRVRISVYQPQGGKSWQAPLRALKTRLGRRWLQDEPELEGEQL